jgi:hypothetical protein
VFHRRSLWRVAQKNRPPLVNKIERLSCHTELYSYQKLHVEEVCEGEWNYLLPNYNEGNMG